MILFQGLDPIVEPYFNETKLTARNVKNISEITEHLSSVTSTMAFYIARKFENSPKPVVVVSPASIIVRFSKFLFKHNLLKNKSQVGGPKAYGVPFEPVTAKEMLKELAGFTHHYITGIYLIFCGNIKPGDVVDRNLWKERYFESRTLVKLKNLDSNMIDNYLEIDEPL